MAKELKLPYTIRNLEEEIAEANIRNIIYEDFLLSLLEKEYDLRKANGIKNRIRLAKFPYKKHIEDLVLEDLSEDARNKIKVFSSLEFIKTGQNIIFAGNPGTGKTHIVIGLEIEACNLEYKVLFITIPLLVNELGYISFDKEASELLFTYLSIRAGRKSIIITTNLSFERWDEIFKDPVMIAAMIDRLTHKSYIVNMNGNSYRLKKTKLWLEEQ